MRQRVTVGVLGRDIGLPLLEIVGASRLLHAEDHPPHSHPTWELLAMLWGEMVQEIGGRRLTLKGGNLLILRPGVLHGPPKGQLKPGKFLWLRIGPWPARLAGSPFLPEDYRALLDALEHSAGAIRAMDPTLKSHVASYWRMVNQFAARGETAVSSVKLRAMTGLLLIRVADCLRKRARPDTHPDPMVRAACSYMAERFSEALTVRQIAAHIGYDASWFQKRFRAQMGAPIGSHLQSLRVEKAKDLLRDGQADVTQIALQVGFSSSQSFARAFRKFTGQSPSEYRQRAT